MRCISGFAVIFYGDLIEWQEVEIEFRKFVFPLNKLLKQWIFPVFDKVEVIFVNIPRFRAELAPFLAFSVIVRRTSPVRFNFRIFFNLQVLPQNNR